MKPFNTLPHFRCRWGYPWWCLASLFNQLPFKLRTSFRNQALLVFCGSCRCWHGPGQWWLHSFRTCRCQGGQVGVRWWCAQISQGAHRLSGHGRGQVGLWPLHLQQVSSGCHGFRIKVANGAGRPHFARVWAVDYRTRDFRDPGLVCRWRNVKLLGLVSGNDSCSHIFNVQVTLVAEI